MSVRRSLDNLSYLKEKETQEKDLLKVIEKDVDYIIGNLYVKKIVNDNSILLYIINNKYDLINNIYYKNEDYKSFDSDFVANEIKKMLLSKAMAIDKENKLKNKIMIENMINYLIEVKNQNGFYYPVSINASDLLKDRFKDEDINYIKNSTEAIKKFNQLFKDEIKEEKELLNSYNNKKVDTCTLSLGKKMLGLFLGITEGFKK